MRDYRLLIRIRAISLGRAGIGIRISIKHNLHSEFMSRRDASTPMNSRTFVLASAAAKIGIKYIKNKLGSPRAHVSCKFVASFSHSLFLHFVVTVVAVVAAVAVVVAIFQRIVFSKWYHAHIGLVIYRTLFYILWNSEQWAHYTLLKSGRAWSSSSTSGDVLVQYRRRAHCMVRVF